MFVCLQPAWEEQQHGQPAGERGRRPVGARLRHTLPHGGAERGGGGGGGAARPAAAPLQRGGARLRTGEAGQ